MSLKIISWNVNGLRAVLKKSIYQDKDFSFIELVKSGEYDVICLQETKSNKDQLPKEALNIAGYKAYFASAEKKGYSGVAVYIKNNYETKVSKGFNIDKFDKEGRTLLVKDVKNKLILVNVYVPNGKKDQGRLDYKMEFKKTLEEYCNKQVENGYHIVVCGDINTAHNEIDLSNPKANSKTSGFLPIEREWITQYLEQGYIDSYRFINPEKVKYSWWSVRSGARARNVGWRLDYFFISKSLESYHVNTEIHNEIIGSDHCPVSIELNF